MIYLCLRELGWPPLSQVVACHQLNITPLLTLSNLDFLSIWQGQNSLKFQVQIYSRKEMHLKISSAKCYPFCSGLSNIDLGQVNVGSGNGVLPDITKTLPEPILTSHLWGSVTFTREQFHCVLKPLFCIISLNTVLLTHWGCVTQICVDKLTIIGLDNGLLPGKHQAIIWTNVRILFHGLNVSN